ncbi:MAG: MMPL family transporter, partial [Phycisphaerae bacterium]|nr:MMPL family transporter [Phycisphaerae bacterium]
SISVAAILVMHLLTVGASFGLRTGTAERIFVFVLLYGAGVDYSLLLISRYRELLDTAAPHDAVVKSLDATFPAIAASAGTDAAGLLMLCFAKFGIFRTTGPAVAMALVVAMLAAVTLVPALLAIVGPRLFWPGGQIGQIGRRRLWPRVARLVTARPALVLGIAIAILAAPVARGVRLTWVYDTLASIKADEYDAARGAEMAKRHWSVGEVAPATFLIRADGPITADKWKDLSRRLTKSLGDVEGVRDVRSLTAPLGQGPASVAAAALGIAGDRVRAEYLSSETSNHKAMRLVAVLDYAPLTLEAMDTVKRTQQAAKSVLARSDVRAEVHISGATAEMIDIREVTQRDFYVVAALALGVIFIILLALLRDVILATFMVLSTVLSYLAT